GGARRWREGRPQACAAQAGRAGKAAPACEECKCRGVDHGCRLFVESEEWQAAEIAKITGKRVYCTDTARMIEPSRPTQRWRCPPHPDPLPPAGGEGEE